MLNLTAGGAHWALHNLPFAAFIVKLGVLAPPMIPVLMHPPGIEGGLMGTLDAYAQGVHNAPPAGDGGAHSALQLVQRMRAWHSPDG